MTKRFTVDYERTLGHPVEDAFAWLTDYEAADARRAGSVIEQREVVDTDDEAGRIVLEEEIRSLGLTREVRTVVEVDPPDAWQATVHGADAANPDLFTYRLEPLDEASSRLEVEYALAGSLLERLAFRLLEPLIRREIDAMWDGYVATMDAELGVDPL